MYYRIERDRLYGVAEQKFVESAPQEDIVPLYRDTSDNNSPVWADAAYLRETLLFYGWPVGEELRTPLDKIRDIQEQYAPRLAALQEARAGADMRDDAEEAAAIRAEYRALLQERRERTEAVEHG